MTGRGAHHVRKATAADLAEVAAWGARFHSESPWSGRAPFVPEDFSATMLQLILSDSGAVFLSEDGFVCGMIYPVFFNGSYRLAQEICWYASAGGGRALRGALEAWARDGGAAAIQFSCLANEREAAIRRLYRGLDYEASETSFVKTLDPAHPGERKEAA